MLTVARLPASSASSARPSAGSIAANATSPGALRQNTGGAEAAGADDSASQSSQSSADASSGGADAVSSNSSGAKPGTAAKAAASARKSSGSRPAKAAAGGGGAPSAASAAGTSASAADGAGGFSATLAESLAATSAEEAAPGPATAAKTDAESNTDDSGAHPAKSSGADPVANALALFEQALASGQVSAPPAAAAGGGTISQGTPSSAATSTAISLGSQLIQTVATDAKATPSIGTAAAGSTSSPSSAASSAPTPSGAATAALAAAQLTAGSHPGLQQAKALTPTLALSSPVGTSAWTDELGTRLTWMAHQGIQSASLQLSPEHLGPVQVSISVRDGQASVWFGAAQSDTRTALQQSLPQLRQLFASQGLTLADAGVSRDSPRGQGQPGAPRPGTTIAAVAGVSSEGSSGLATVTGGLGLLDTYA